MSGAAQLTLRAALNGNAPFALLIVLAAALPLFRVAALEDSFITPKMALLIAFLPLLGLAHLPRPGGPEAVMGAWRDPLVLLAGGLAMLHAVSLVWAASATLALAAAIVWTAFALLLPLAAAALPSPPHAWHLWTVLFATATAIGAWTVYEDAARAQGVVSVAARLPDWRGFLSAGLGNSGHIAGFMGLTLAAGVIRFLTAERFPVVTFLALLVMGAAFVVTWSVGSAGATLLALAVWSPLLVKFAPSRRQLARRGAVLAGLAAAAALFYMAPHPLNPHPQGLLAEAFASGRWQEGGPTRIAIYLTSLAMIGARPILGWGAGNFTYGYVQQTPDSVFLNPQLARYGGAFTNDAHNEVLHLWAETGVLGAALFVAIAVLALVRGAGLARRSECVVTRRASAAAGCAITVLLLDSLMTFPLRLPAHTMVFFLSLATLAALGRGTAGAPKPGDGKLVLGGMIGLALLLTIPAGLRVAAEWHLKTGRSIAETSEDGSPPPWAVADAGMREVMTALADGRTSDALDLRKAMRPVTTSEAMTAAAEHFETALLYDPAYSNASSRLGYLRLMQGSDSEADVILTHTLDSLQAPEIHERLGAALLFLGYRDEAVRHWGICYERRPIMRPYYRALIEAAGGIAPDRRRE